MRKKPQALGTLLGGTGPFYPHAPSLFRSQSTVQDRLEDLELAAIVGTVIILLGILAEAIAELLRHSDHSHLILSMIGNGLVGIGLIHELQATRVTIIDTREDNAESERKVAEANKAAAEARERTATIEALTAWRHISEEQYTPIVDTIRSKSQEIDLLVEYERGDPESFGYAREIAWLFQSAGVTRIRADANQYLVPGIFGIHIAAAPEIDVSDIIEAFSTVGIELIVEHKDLSRHFSSNIKAPNLYIFVAPKIPPFVLPMGPQPSI